MPKPLKKIKGRKVRVSVDIDQVIYEQFVTRYGKPDTPKHLMSFAKEQGKTMKYNQAKNIITRNKDVVIAPPRGLMKPSPETANSYESKSKSNTSTPSPDDNFPIPETAKSNATFTTENTETTDKHTQMAEMRKLRGMIHN